MNSDTKKNSAIVMNIEWILGIVGSAIASILAWDFIAMHKKVYRNTTEIAVLKESSKNIAEDVSEIKKDVKTLLSGVK